MNIQDKHFQDAEIQPFKFQQIGVDPMPSSVNPTLVKSQSVKFLITDHRFRLVFLLTTLIVLIVGALISGCGTRDSTESTSASTQDAHAAETEAVRPVETDLYIYTADTMKRLEDARKARQKVGVLIQDGLQNPSHLDNLEYRERLDRALSDLVNYGAILQDSYVALLKMNKETVPASLRKIEESREAFGPAMLAYDSSMREAMPALISEPDIPADPEKFRAVAKNFVELNRYDDAVVDAVNEATESAHPVSKRK